jgi:hypothetical protein
MWQRRMAAFHRGKGQILWDVTVHTAYVHALNFLAPGSRDMFDANNKADDYLYRSLCESEFERVQTEDLACRIWEQLKNAHARNAQVQARLFATYRREYENFTHLPGELLTVNSCIKVCLDLQADKSPVVVKGPFFPRVVNPRYRIRGTNV